MTIADAPGTQNTGKQQAASQRWETMREAFLSTDWLMADEVTAGGELHPYPARYISAIPAKALDILDPRGVVLDPFCGSGTTLFEARRRGLPAVGNDLNPIATLVSRVRNQVWDPSDSVRSIEFANLIADAAMSGDAPPVDDIPKLNHWFSDWAIHALAGARQFLLSIDSEDPWRDRIALAISSCVVRLSRQESDTRYAAIDKPGDVETAAKMLFRAVTKTGEWLQRNALSNAESAIIRTGDARDLRFLDDDCVSATVFSPPYPNAYEYWLYHKYRMYWLGYDPIAVRNLELGARPHYCRPNGLTELDFARQMGDVFAELHRVMSPGSPMVIVVGDSVIRGQAIDNARLLEDAATAQGFKSFAATKRPILKARSSFNSSLTRGRKDEHVLLLRSE